MEQEPASQPAEELRDAENLLIAGQLTCAIDSFHRAEQVGANADQCAAGRWQAAMLLGDFPAAWRESDAIRFRGTPDPHRFWNGEPVQNKRLMVRCLHGLGDAVQMLQYLPRLREHCAEVIVQVPPGFLPLAPCFRGVTQVITWGEQAALDPTEWDVQVEVMELPYLFRTTIADLPVATRYLSVPVLAAEQTARGMGVARGPRVGIVWSASEWDPTRCLPMACLARLLAVPEVEFWNLQGGAAHDRAVDEAALRNVRDAACLGDGLVTLAAAIVNLDLVITVDTLAAHLAGALGRNAWVLLQQRADWRWMHASDDSPWYPTLRLFRQQSQDDWNGLIERVCEELEQWKRS